VAGWEDHHSDWSVDGLTLAGAFAGSKSVGIVPAIRAATLERQATVARVPVWGQSDYVYGPGSSGDDWTMWAPGNFASRVDAAIDLLITKYVNTETGTCDSPTAWTEAALMTHLGETRIKYAANWQCLPVAWVYQVRRILDHLIWISGAGRTSISGGYDAMVYLTGRAGKYDEASDYATAVTDFNASDWVDIWAAGVVKHFGFNYYDSIYSLTRTRSQACSVYLRGGSASQADLSVQATFRKPSYGSYPATYENLDYPTASENVPVVLASGVQSLPYNSITFDPGGGVNLSGAPASGYALGYRLELADLKALFKLNTSGGFAFYAS
jgi:hypothetical protein